MLSRTPDSKHANDCVGNGTIDRSALQTFANFAFALPPTKAEQEAIAEALSDADALIESLEQLLAKKRQIKQGAMQELLTGKKRLPGFSGIGASRQRWSDSEDWEVVPWVVSTTATG